ncbi:MAG: DUF1990 family protein [Acidobacteriota bacterium]
MDHNRIRLGTGPEVFKRAVEALKRWEMFNIGWLHLCWPAAPIETGATVAVLAHILGFWSLNACRIALVIDEHREVRKFGFAYGTLPRARRARPGVVYDRVAQQRRFSVVRHLCLFEAKSLDC